MWLFAFGPFIQHIASRPDALAGVLLAALLLSCPAAAQSDEDLAALKAQVEQLAKASRLAEAAPLAEQLAGKSRERFGDSSGQYAEALYRLAQIQRVLGRFTDAVVPLQTALAIVIKARGSDDLIVSTIQNDLALTLKSLNRFDEAEPLYVRALATREQKLGTEHPGVAQILNNLGTLYWTDGRFAAAEPRYRAALAIREKRMAGSGDHGESLNNLAALHWSLGRYSDAEPLYKRALELSQAQGTETIAVAVNLNNLAQLYHDQGRLDDAEPLFKRALDIRRKVLPAGHPDVAQGENNLAWLFHRQKRFAEALPLYRSALAAFEQISAEHATVGSTLNNIALLHHEEGRHAEAVPLFRRAIEIRRAALGESNAEVGQSHNKMALALQALGRFEEAETNYEKALLIRLEALGPEHPDIVQNLDDVASMHEQRQYWQDAVDFARDARDIVQRRAKRGALATEAVAQGSGRDEIARTRQVLSRMLRVAWPLMGEQPKLGPELTRDAFLSAQLAGQTSAEAALAQMAARQSRGGGPLAALARQQQDLSAEWQALDKRLYLAVAERPEKRDLAIEQQLRSRLAAVDGQRSTIEERLRSEFPEYFAMSHPEPVDLSAAQRLLRSSELLLVYAFAGADAFVFAIARDAVRWRKLALSSDTIADKVRALRCGLDASEWKRSDSCPGLLGTAPADGTLPFSLRIAHELGEALIGPVKDMTRSRQLLIVPAGPLTSLPFQVLVMDPPRSADFRSVAWLGRRHALSVLPSVGSLGALRLHARTSRASKPYFGLGNPLVSGDPVNPDDAKRAAEAAAIRSCDGRGVGRIKSVSNRGLAGQPVDFFRGTLADVDHLRRQSPLPETADELCAVGRSLKASGGDVLLGSSASERTLKSLSATDRLGQYRIVHFATHGLMAGEMAGVAEPSLLLTPPGQASEEDDGLLTASEVAGLRLDADWVILSACNTAAGEKLGAEAMSGLARAFFYAGARALLVSHWYVDSDTAVKLTTRAFAELERRPQLGRAEALRIAMTAMIGSKDRGEAHPSRWAPFVVVGEGAAVR